MQVKQGFSSFFFIFDDFSKFRRDFRFREPYFENGNNLAKNVVQLVFNPLLNTTSKTPKPHELYRDLIVKMKCKYNNRKEEKF